MIQSQNRIWWENSFLCWIFFSFSFEKSLKSFELSSIIKIMIETFGACFLSVCLPVIEYGLIFQENRYLKLG